ncbi:hypothetical protein [Polaribacter sp. Hel_I_88]|uniref:hypothetical protein n=1 Tax=Polaribacter sp. Hel_I_88 TaxID=1250006 RepID=UPI000B138989|nr:hypothetical protein [Polaribacter sp. Hel_I_88]
MEEIKEKAIELLLDIISKEDFEMILYEKVKTEDLVKNKLLFDLVSINYRDENYQNKLFDILKDFLSKESLIIYKVNIYCSKIINAETNKDIYDWFEKILDLFCVAIDEYNLMWDFLLLSDRLGFLYMKYEKEEIILKDVKHLSLELIKNFKVASSIKEKHNILNDGFNLKYKSAIKWYEFWK